MLTRRVGRPGVRWFERRQRVATGGAQTPVRPSINHLLRRRGRATAMRDARPDALAN